MVCTTIMDPGDGLVTIIESGNHTGGLPRTFGLLSCMTCEAPVWRDSTKSLNPSHNFAGWCYSPTFYMVGLFEVGHRGPRKLKFAELRPNSGT